jgi:hypothetical protein
LPACKMAGDGVQGRAAAPPRAVRAAESAASCRPPAASALLSSWWHPGPELSREFVAQATERDFPLVPATAQRSETDLLKRREESEVQQLPVWLEAEEKEEEEELGAYFLYSFDKGLGGGVGPGLLFAIKNTQAGAN